MGRLKSSIGVFFLAVAIAGCAGSETVLMPEVQKRVWPAAPDVARIQFVQEFSDLAGLGVRPSVWGRIVRLMAGKQNESMVRPMSVVATADGNTIFVADPDAHCVHRYDIVDAQYDCLRPDGGSLRSPIGLSIGDGDDLFVADSELGQIFKAAAGAERLEPFAVQHDFEQPTGIYWDAKSEKLYVCDTKRHVVVVLDSEGRLVGQIGRRGDQPGEFNFPVSVWVSEEDEVLVTDSLNFRVQRFTKDGAFVRSFGMAGDLHGSFTRPKGVATDGVGHVYVVDAMFHAIQIFDQYGVLLLALGGRGHAPGEFWLPNGIFVSANDRIYVADSYNRRIQIFEYIGPKQ